MVPLGDEADSLDAISAQDDLARLIRWSVPESVCGAEPPSDVWPRILGRVREMPAPTAPKRLLGHSAFPLAPFVQAVVISALVLAFGLGVDRSVVTPRREYRIGSTPTIRKVRATEDSAEDVLRGYMLAQRERELPSRKGGNIR